MAQDFRFVIIISADGETVTGEVHGIKGKSCEDVQRVLDEVGQELDYRHTWEYEAKEPVRLGSKPGSGKLTLGKS
jgi:hypothetical protein